MFYCTFLLLNIVSVYYFQARDSCKICDFTTSHKSYIFGYGIT